MEWQNGLQDRGWGRSKRNVEAFEETGNAAFDEYRADTLKRLEEERTAFTGFLEKLRAAKDKAEFEQFMADRGRKTEEKTISA